MAYLDDHTVGDELAESKARWAALPVNRKILMAGEILSSVALLWSFWAEPSRSVQSTIWIVWAAFMIVGSAYFFRDAFARRRAEQNTLEGIER